MSQAEQFPLTELRLAVSILVHAMVDDPSAVVIANEDVKGGRLFRIQVAPADKGKLIGANGRSARSLRILLNAAGRKYGESITLDIGG
jgi:predicted RNA-binding protein YlqC (UPF0109 family)